MFRERMRCSANALHSNKYLHVWQLGSLVTNYSYFFQITITFTKHSVWRSTFTANVNSWLFNVSSSFSNVQESALWLGVSCSTIALPPKLVCFSQGKWETINSRTANRTSCSEDCKRTWITSKQFTVVSKMSLELWKSDGISLKIARWDWPFGEDNKSSQALRKDFVSVLLTNTSPMRLEGSCSVRISWIVILLNHCFRACKVLFTMSGISETKKHYTVNHFKSFLVLMTLQHCYKSSLVQYK